MSVLNITKENFETEVVGSMIPVVIDFQIESDDKVWPMIAPGGGNDEVFSEEDLEKK